VIAGTAIASISIFIGALWLSGVLQASRSALDTVQGAIAILRNEGLNDDAREQGVRHASLALFRLFASILMRSTLTLLVSTIPIWLADFAGLASSGDVIRFLSRWDVILIATGVITLGYPLMRKLCRSKLAILFWTV
jgi:hypothetical protein